MDKRRLKLDLEPTWDDIHAHWPTCESFFKDAGLSGDHAYALSMVAQELLENAVKYGSFEGPQKKVGLLLEAKSGEALVEVRSPVKGDLERLDRLDDTIQWIRGFQDPFEAYVEKLKAVSAQPYAAGESGLGLVRIAYEGQCILDFFVNAESVLAISAVFRSRGLS